ncbi:MAG: hypothetical protein K0S39_1171, partial [Paenibacillus sp.]|nr:hypothetical protein [Paenibacillus sp.]
ALMRMVQVNRRKLESKWGLITVNFMNPQRIRILTDLQLPLGNHVIWEFSSELPEEEGFTIKGVLEKQREVNHNAGKYEYQARLIPGEDHLLMIRMKQSYSSSHELKIKGFSQQI